MICKNCRTQIPDSAKFCPECGVTVLHETVEKSDLQVTPAEDSTVAQAAQAQDKTFLKFVGILMIILFAIVWWQSNRPVTTYETAKKQIITICADEQGEYGEMFTLNKGTKFEESYYIYRVPAGTYTVTNTGKYMDQFNVYGETVYVTDDGWEELSDIVYVKLFQPSESDIVTINDGQIIEIHGNGVWELSLN